METRELNKDDREKLKLELTNSIKGRLTNIKKGAFTALAGLVLTSAFYFYNIGPSSGMATIISIVILFYGLINCIWWFLVARSNNQFKNDIDKGVKLVGHGKISSYNFLTKKITLDNGLKIDRFEITGHWKKGDHIYLEQLPTSNFILKCDNKNAG